MTPLNRAFKTFSNCQNQIVMICFSRVRHPERWWPRAGHHAAGPRDLGLGGDHPPHPRRRGVPRPEETEARIPRPEQPRHCVSGRHAGEGNLQEAGQRLLWPAQLPHHLQSAGRPPHSNHPFEFTGQHSGPAALFHHQKLQWIQWALQRFQWPLQRSAQYIRGPRDSWARGGCPPSFTPLPPLHLLWERKAQ